MPKKNQGSALDSKQETITKAGGFKKKIALVVGGASGMGNAVVRQLAAQGCRVHVLDVKQAAAGLFQRCDIRDYNQVREGVRKVMTQEGRIDLLFIAAGVHLFANIEDTSIEEFERVLSINLKGPFYVLKEVLPIYEKTTFGQRRSDGLRPGIYRQGLQRSVRVEQSGPRSAHQKHCHRLRPLQR